MYDVFFAADLDSELFIETNAQPQDLFEEAHVDTREPWETRFERAPKKSHKLDVRLAVRR